MLGIFLIFNIVFLTLSKGIVYTILARLRTKGYNFRNILIVGSRSGAKEVIDAIGDRLEAGYKILGCLDIDKRQIGKKVRNGVQIIGTIESTEKIYTAFRKA